MTGPVQIHREAVQEEWIDYNGHMNVAFYVLAFDHATDAFFEFIGLDETCREAETITTFAAEAHVTYQREVFQGDELEFTTQLIGYDEKRIHYFHRMFHAGEQYLAATFESLSLGVDAEARRVRPFPHVVLVHLERLWEQHAGLERPPEAGRTIGLKRGSG